ncbi:MAG: DUF5694 domain-containing protein [Bacteroidota bacterium]
MNRLLLLWSFPLFLSCLEAKEETEEITSHTTKGSVQINEKIKVLNFATFHMATTTDSIRVEFDENAQKNQQEIQRIAELISKFRPTVICVEVPFNKTYNLNRRYQMYLKNPENKSLYPGEIGLLAFEIGRLNTIDSLYGIDHKMNYDYQIGNKLTNTIDSSTYKTFFSNPFATISELNIFEEGLTTKEKLVRMNHPKFLETSQLANADILTHVGTDDNFEGADEAAKYYQRNLRIYSNLNRIPLQKDDRVFILMGASHTAFLNNFLKRSIKYEVVNTLEYLN